MVVLGVPLYGRLDIKGEKVEGCQENGKQGCIKKDADSETSPICSVRLDEFGLYRKGLFNFDDRDGKSKLELLQHPLGANYSKDKIYIADS